MLVRPIETKYGGHLFRSRTEARWAVFFDAAQIEWQYEVEGFNVNGTYYLPDFWLPGLKTFAEVKPDDEAEIGRAAPLLQSLATARGQPAIILAGQPAEAEAQDRVRCYVPGGNNGTAWARWRECIFCGAIGLLRVGEKFTCRC